MEKLYQRFKTVVQKFGLSKQYLAGDFYRICQISPDCYSIACLKAGPCGESLYHPQLKVSTQHHQLVILSYFDNVETPTQSVLLSEESTEFLETKLEILLARFEHLLSIEPSGDSV